MDRVVVLGVGNVLMGDDGLGPTLASVLEARFRFDEAVEVLDAGTPGLDFVPYVTDCRALLVLDTVHADAPPGTLRVYRRDQLLATAPPPRMSPHQPGLREALMAAELTDSTPEEVILFGIVPERVELGTELSEPVAAAVEPTLKAVIAELERLGIACHPRTPPLDPDLWWRRQEAR